jgi:Aminotransferase class-III
MRSGHPSIGHVRGQGLMIGIELVRDQVAKEPTTELCNAVLCRAFEHGLLVLSCGRSVVRIVPALNIARPLVEEGLAIFERALTEAEQTTERWQRTPRKCPPRIPPRCRLKAMADEGVNHTGTHQAWSDLRRRPPLQLVHHPAVHHVLARRRGWHREGRRRPEDQAINGRQGQAVCCRSSKGQCDDMSGPLPASAAMHLITSTGEAHECITPDA